MQLGDDVLTAARDSPAAFENHTASLHAGFHGKDPQTLLKHRNQYLAALRKPWRSLRETDYAVHAKDRKIKPQRAQSFIIQTLPLQVAFENHTANLHAGFPAFYESKQAAVPGCFAGFYPI